MIFLSVHFYYFLLDVFFHSSLQREDLSDDELLDDLEDDDMTASMKSQNGATRSSAVAQGYPVDLNLSPAEKRALYKNSAWRMEVRS